MKGVRFTKAEADLIRALLETEASLARRDRGKRQAVAASALAKLETAELPVKKAQYGVTVNEAIDAFRGVLGRRLLTPPWSAIGVLSAMKNRLAALGLTRGDCETVARVAATEWQGTVRAESIVRQADKLMAMSQQQLDLEPRRTEPAGPVELSEEEV